MSSTPFISVFDQVFDVAILGAGYAGYFAAMQLSEQGKSVLLMDAYGDLLWESGRCFVPTPGPPEPSEVSPVSSATSGSPGDCDDGNFGKLPGGGSSGGSGGSGGCWRICKVAAGMTVHFWMARWQRCLRRACYSSRRFARCTMCIRWLWSRQRA